MAKTPETGDAETNEETADARLDSTETDDQAQDKAAEEPVSDVPAERDTSESDAALAAALATSPLVAAEIAEPEPERKEPVAAADDSDEHDHEDDDHHAGRSLAARALTGLILLLVGGGVALWGAPKVAPHLPSGLGPVKTWLLPGEALSQQEIAALRDEVDTRLGSIDTSLDEDRVAAIAGDAIAASQAEFSDRIAALSDQVAASDSADIEARLAQVEARLEGIASQLEALNDLELEGLSDEQTQALSGFASVVEGLRGELAAIAQQQGAIAQRIDDVEVSVNRKLEEAEAEVVAVTEEAERTQSATVIRAALATIEAALNSGDPYETTLATLATETGQEPPTALQATAATGVSTLGALRTGFADAAHDAIKADIRADDGEGVAARFASFLESQIASRSLTPQEGPGTDAVLSRAEDALRRDNLAAAAEELSTLSDTAREAMAGWISKAEARVAALSAFTALQASLTAQN